jgi:hypothetical protein
MNKQASTKTLRRYGLLPLYTSAAPRYASARRANKKLYRFSGRKEMQRLHIGDTVILRNSGPNL